MAHSNRQDPSGYMDNVRVKISEKYKPPPKLGLAMSYAQRLTLNKQIQDGMPQYEFLLEKTVKEKMTEWRNVRYLWLEQLNKRLDVARSEEKKRLEDRNSLKVEELESAPQTYLGPATGPPQSQPILIPTQVSTSILTPIPLKQNFVGVTDKSPFNLSDFEADTSSPFDNMELKSINDMQQLAEVLNKDLKPPPPPPPSSSGFSASTTSTTTPSYNLSNYTTNYNIPPPSSSSFINPGTYYNRSNGYYYNHHHVPDTITAAATKQLTTFNAPYTTSTYSNQTKSIDTNFGNLSQINSSDNGGNGGHHQSLLATNSMLSPVPDILKSLNAKLNSCTNNKMMTMTMSEKKRMDLVVVKSKSDDLDAEGFNMLPKDVQESCKSISSMGFPLARVARVYKLLGNDQKKVVEHLLVMSELLDLGFSETNVSRALLQSDNDRDKALDLLTL